MSTKEISWIKRLRKNIHPIVKVPKSAYKMYVGSFAVSVILDLITKRYPYLLTYASDSIENNAVVVGVIFFLLYQLKDVVFTSALKLAQYVNTRKKAILEVDVAKKAIRITSKVSEKVYFEGKTVSNSKIIGCVGKYIEKHRSYREGLVRKAISLIIFLGSIVDSIRIAASDFDNTTVLAITIISSVIVVAFFSYRKIVKSQDFYKSDAELNHKLEEEKNDCINVKATCSAHSEFILNNYVSTLKKRAENIMKDGVRGWFTEIKNTFVCSVAIIVLVANIIFSQGIDNLNSVTFLNIVTLSTVFSSILSNISTEISSIQNLISEKKMLDREKAMFLEIMKTADMEKDEEHISGNVSLKPFAFSYNKTSEFVLISKKQLEFKRGAMTLLKGASNAGKSTLLKIICGKISVGNNARLKTIHYFPKSAFGTQSLLSEVTFNHVDREKLIEILKGVCIYDRLVEQAGDRDIVDYLASNNREVSTGMEDKLILARTLYNMDNYDLVLIDEPIGSVDLEAGCKIIQFIKEYAAKRHDKIVVVTSHQYRNVESQFDEIVNVKIEGCESIVS